MIKNPTLSDLVGGICSVTLGDEEARSRGTQKSVLERKAPPTFPLVIEMRERAMWVAHWVEDSVDCLLNGKIPIVQVRRRNGSSSKRRVVVEECPYDVADSRGTGAEGSARNPTAVPGAGVPPATPGLQGKDASKHVADGITNSVFDSMFGYSAGGFGNSFSGPPVESQRSASGASGDSVYGWAARLRDVSEEEALAELSSMGYTDGGSSHGKREKFSFAQGTGQGKKKGRRGQSIGRATRRRK